MALCSVIYCRYPSCIVLKDEPSRLSVTLSMCSFFHETSDLLSPAVLFLSVFFTCFIGRVTADAPPHLFDGSDGADVVHLSAPLVVAVVLSPLGHVPQVLAPAEVLVLVGDPSSNESRVKQQQW